MQHCVTLKQTIRSELRAHVDQIRKPFRVLHRRGLEEEIDGSRRRRMKWALTWQPGSNRWVRQDQVRIRIVRHCAAGEECRRRLFDSESESEAEAVFNASTIQTRRKGGEDVQQVNIGKRRFPGDLLGGEASSIEQRILPRQNSTFLYNSACRLPGGGRVSGSY
jgi:hypothetical protein